METSNKNNKSSWIMNETFLSSFGALFLFVFISFLILIIIDNKIGDIEEKLKYMPIQANGSEMRGEPEVAGQTVYVPIYSNIYANEKAF